VVGVVVVVVVVVLVVRFGGEVFLLSSVVMNSGKVFVRGVRGLKGELGRVRR